MAADPAGRPATSIRPPHLDTRQRRRVTTHSFEALGRTLTLPAEDTIAGSGSGNISLTNFANDMTRTVTKSSAQATYTLDVLTNRYRSYSTTTGGTTVNRTNHYSNDPDSPSWIAEGGWYTRMINGLGA